MLRGWAAPRGNSPGSPLPPCQQPPPTLLPTTNRTPALLAGFGRQQRPRDVQDSFWLFIEVLDRPARGRRRLFSPQTSCWCSDSNRNAAATATRLEEEAEDLATGVLPAGLLVVHDPLRRGKDDVPELAGGAVVDGAGRKGGAALWAAGTVPTRCGPGNRGGDGRTWREGSRVEIHFSMSSTGTSRRGEMTPHLLRRPLSSTTILPERRSSTISNSLM